MWVLLVLKSTRNIERKDEKSVELYWTNRKKIETNTSCIKDEWNVSMLSFPVARVGCDVGMGVIIRCASGNGHDLTNLLLS
jgi:hypothetical protein